MGRKKESLSFWPASFEAFEPFNEDEWEVLENALECDLPEDFIVQLEGRMFWWLSAFRVIEEFQFGKQELGIARRADQDAKKLIRNLVDLGSAGEMALEDLCGRHKVSRTVFLLCLCEVSGLSKYFEELIGDAVQPDYAQFHEILSIFDRFQLPTTITHDAGGTSFNPSPFVVFVHQLWRIRPELALCDRSGDFYPAFSQWISARVRLVRQSDRAGG